MKTCHTCRKTKPISEFYFNKKLQTKDGHSSNCKECSKVFSKLWKHNNPQRLAFHKHQYYLKHKDKILAYNRTYWSRLSIKQKRAIRFDIFNRDHFTCQYCGRKAPDVVLELDHILPKARMGKNEYENYKTACYDCNRGKGKNLIKPKNPR